MLLLLKCNGIILKDIAKAKDVILVKFIVVELLWMSLWVTYFAMTVVMSLLRLFVMTKDI